MTTRWALRLPRGEEQALARCRLIPGLEVAEEADSLWVRGPELTPAHQQLLLAIPAAERFEVALDGALRPAGRRLASGRLPALEWQRAADAVRVALPAAAFAGTPLRPAAIELIRTAEVRPPNLLLVDAAAWTRYGETAPQVRLARWTFAAGAESRVLIRGLPLPPLPGRPFTEEDGIALPAGWGLARAVSPAVLREVLRIGSGDLALMAPDGRWEHLVAGDFVPASRGALRSLAAGEVRA